MVIIKIEKEKRIIELYKQGKTIREIAKEVHMSFGDISSIIKKHTGEDKYKEKTISKDTQAINLYSKGRTPVDVVIELDMSSDEATRIYREFWKLKNLEQLDAVYEEMENEMPSFLKLFRLMKDEGLFELDIIELLKHSRQLPSLDLIVKSRIKEKENLDNQNQKITLRFYKSQENAKKLDKYLEEHQPELDKLKEYISSESKRLRHTQDMIRDLMNGEDYTKINGMVERKVNSLLGQKIDLLMASVVTALLAIRMDPEKDVLIHYSDYFNNPRNNFGGTNNEETRQINFETFIQTHHRHILETANMLHDKILKTVQSQMLPSSPKP
jgi:cytidylate kinase